MRNVATDGTNDSLALNYGCVVYCGDFACLNRGAGASTVLRVDVTYCELNQRGYVSIA